MAKQKRIRRSKEEIEMMISVISKLIEYGDYNDQNCQKILYDDHAIEISIPMLRIFRSKHNLKLRGAGPSVSREEEIRRAAAEAKEEMITGWVDFEKALAKVEQWQRAVLTLSECVDELRAAAENVRKRGNIKF